MSYDLESLGPAAFQDLAGAIVIRALGSHVQRMGMGRDGGRDLLATEQVNWAFKSGGRKQIWKGTTVFQVKHKANISRSPIDVAWVWRQIHEELQEWSDPKTSRGSVPENIVFVTNVSLSAVAEIGGVDAINGKIGSYLAGLKDEKSEEGLSPQEAYRAREERQQRRRRMKPLKNWRVLDRNYIEGLLDAHHEIRRAFASLLTVGDVLDAVATSNEFLTDADVTSVLREQARRSLIEDRYVYFDEAGGDARGVSVEQVIIDLPVHIAGTRVTEMALTSTIARSDHILVPSMKTLASPTHIVLTGAPGNGKTTLSKFLVHLYRAALLQEDSALGEQHQNVVRSISKRCEQLGLAYPHHRRWPFRVDLAEFAKRKAISSEVRLLAWIAELVTEQTSSKRLASWQLKRWLREWPCLLVLDGLDEVTEPASRKALLSDIEAFSAEAEAENWDMLIVVTTRPVGYVEELPALQFERINLTDLSIDQALAYGRHVTLLRIPDDVRRRNSIESLLQEASRSDALKNLLRTPLQVLIMSIIAETSRQFSPSRYSLFMRYYQVIELREQTKTLGLSHLLREHAAQVLSLHRRAGFLLQCQSERSFGATAVLSLADLRSLAWQVLEEDEYKPESTHSRLLDDIVTAATHRLVLLSPRDDGFGFDVRSLQELMAGLYLTTGDREEVFTHLRVIAASPHWRNTFLFCVGRFFSEPQPTVHQAATELILTIDQDSAFRLGGVFPVGHELAWQMLDDGMAASFPRWQRMLTQHAVLGLQTDLWVNLEDLVRRMARVIDSVPETREIIVTSFKRALARGGGAQSRVESIQQQILRLAPVYQFPPEVRSLAAVISPRRGAVNANVNEDWDDFELSMLLHASEMTAQGDMSLTIEMVRRVPVEANDTSFLFEFGQFAESISTDVDVLVALNESLPFVIFAENGVRRIFCWTFMPEVWRAPVSQSLSIDDLL